MSVKKVLASIASYALVGAVALGVGGTLAQQNETTQTDVNVQTVGIVDIAQLEYERVVDATKGAADGVENANWVALPEYDTEFNGVTYTPDALQKFTKGKSMAPAYYSNGKVMWDDRIGYSSETDPKSHQQPWKEIGAPGSNQLFDDSISNVLDKFVFVQNTGEKDAYVRTVFAFEKGIFTADDYNDKMVHLNRNTEKDGTTWKWTPFSESMKATIGGTEYYLTVATYNRGDGIVKPTEITRPSLLQVFFDPAVENEHIKALGDTYNILAISQAVQADLSPNLNAEQSLNAVFGEVTDESHPWVTPTEIKNENDLQNALLNGGEYTFAANIETLDKSFTVPEKTNVKFNFNGYTLTMKSDADAEKTPVAFDNYGDLTLINGTINARGVNNYGTLNVENFTINALDSSNGIAIYNTGELILNNSTLNAPNGNFNYRENGSSCLVNDGGNVTVTDGSFDTRGWPYAIRNNSGNLIINNIDSLKARRGAIAVSGGAVTINGGSFSAEKYYAIYAEGSDATITVNGGKFYGKKADAYLFNSVTLIDNAGVFTATTVGESVTVYDAK